MANALYDKARERFLTGSINWSSDTIKVMLLRSTGYTVSLSTHEFLTDVSGSAWVPSSSASAPTLGSKTTTGGAADGGDVTFTAVTGAAIGAILIFKSTGTDSTSPLIAYIDTATGLPITPNGGDIIVTWDNGTNKIFRL